MSDHQPMPDDPYYFDWGPEDHDGPDARPLGREQSMEEQMNSLFAGLSLARSRSPPAPPLDSRSAEAEIDLRALDYVSDYDSNLMCSICHAPFVDPVVLECDHTFCSDCYAQHSRGSTQTRCPSCRAYIFSLPKQASRLIRNMCEDIRVKCPSEDCEATHPRGYIIQHVTKECREHQLACPGPDCDKKVKRKNYVDNQCIHSSHIECDCGAVIELGRGEWLQHKDEDCPATGMNCEGCGERISVKAYLAGSNGHICKANTSSYCPGVEYGCTTEIPFATPEELEFHSASCPFARLAPHLKKQAESLHTLTEQLNHAKVRNTVLETSFDRINDIIINRLLPNLHTTSSSTTHEDTPPRVPSPTLSIEEIPRHHSLTSNDFRPFTDLALPAHLRPLTPNFNHNNHTITTSHDEMHDMRTSLSTLTNQLSALQANLSDLDARSSMMIMNETLRLREELAQQGAGLFSTRAQVTWLLNRERERMHMAQRELQLQQREHHDAAAAATRPGLNARGRTVNDIATASTTATGSAIATSPQFAPMRPQAAPAPAAASMLRGDSLNGAPGEGSSSSARSSFSTTAGHAGSGGGVGLVVDGGGAGISSSSPRMMPIHRPNLRRLSGSQERVKL